MNKAKIVLITGAGTGVGRAVAIRFLEEGHTVYLIGRRMAPLEETAKMANKGNAVPIACDVTDEASVLDVFEQVKKEHGRLDVLFNNAGGALSGRPIDEITMEDWKSVLEVNVTGSFLCAREAFRIMRNQDPMGGRIINNGSISAHAPRPGSVPYTTTKHAITGLTKTLSLDGRPFNIACGQIDIGNAETPMTEKFPEGVPQANGQIAAEPVMDVNHVADAVYQMAALPLESNVQFMTIMATKMPFIGRG